MTAVQKTAIVDDDPTIIGQRLQTGTLESRCVLCDRVFVTRRPGRRPDPEDPGYFRHVPFVCPSHDGSRFRVQRRMERATGVRLVEVAE